MGPFGHLHGCCDPGCLTLKALFGLPLRQTTGLVARLLELAGLGWPVPDFSTLCRCQKGVAVTIPYRPSNGALQLLVESTGIKAEGEGKWFAKKDAPSKPQHWRKVHLGIDADSLEIRAIEITGNRVGDAPMLPELHSQIPVDQPVGKVSADGAYEPRGCHAAIAARSAYAVIPARRNAKPRLESTPSAQARNETVRTTRRLGRTI